MELIFNPNGAAAAESGIFGLPYGAEEAKLILIPVPWEVTVSYGSGTGNAPQAIFEASKYVELFDTELGNFFESGISMDTMPKKLAKTGRHAKELARCLITMENNEPSLKQKRSQKKINQLCELMNKHVFMQTTKWINAGKHVGIIGGDHSISLGSIGAHLKKFPEMTILQIDAHCDLRRAFECFTYSHASVMFNVLKETRLKRLVQVGIRDLCEEEFQRTNDSKDRITTFFQADIEKHLAQGDSWHSICEAVAAATSTDIYLSFDIDGLEPALCPNTGTPVPGGLSFQNALYLIKYLVHTGKKIVGFDLVEVSTQNPKDPHDMNANVGAQLLYKICGWCLASNQHKGFTKEKKFSQRG